MKFFAYIAALHAALLCLVLAVSPAGSGSMTLLGVGKAGVAAPVLSIDGTPIEANSSAATTSITLTTTKTNNIIILVIETNGGPISTVSGGGLTWARRAQNSAGTTNIETWWALASSILSGVTITVTPTTTNFTTVIGFAVNGAKTSSPFDGTAVTVSGIPSDPISISTTAANTMIIGAFRFAGTSNPTAGSGFTGLALNADFALAEYQIVSAPQAGLSVTVGTGVGNSNGGIADAIVQGP